MKQWTIYYRIKGIGKAKSHGCDSRDEAVEFIASIKKSGHSFTELKWDGKDASSKTALQMDKESDRYLKTISN